MSRLLGTAIVFAILVFSQVQSWGCGDKFLVSCRVSGHNSAFVASNPGSILILASDTQSIAWLTEKDAPEELTRAGHKVYLVSNRDEMIAILETTQIDILLTDVSDVETLSASALPGDPMIVPMVDKSDRETLVPLRKLYFNILQTPSRKSTFLATVDFAIEDSKMAPRYLDS